MRYESARTDRGNVGMSYRSQAEADKRAADMDAAGCRGCRGVLRWDGKPATCMLSFNGLHWAVAVSKEQMQIGCQCHTIERWRGFTDAQIAAMDSQALAFWSAHRDLLLSICDHAATL